MVPTDGINFGLMKGLPSNLYVCLSIILLSLKLHAFNYIVTTYGYGGLQRHNNSNCHHDELVNPLM